LSLGLFFVTQEVIFEKHLDQNRNLVRLLRLIVANCCSRLSFVVSFGSVQVITGSNLIHYLLSHQYFHFLDHFKLLFQMAAMLYVDRFAATWPIPPYVSPWLQMMTMMAQWFETLAMAFCKMMNLLKIVGIPGLAVPDGCLMLDGLRLVEWHCGWVDRCFLGVTGL
jgi:hypothetical protein